MVGMGPTSFTYASYMTQAHSLKVIPSNIPNTPARHGGAKLQYQHVGGKDRYLYEFGASLLYAESSRPAKAS